MEGERKREREREREIEREAELKKDGLKRDRERLITERQRKID